MKKVNAKRAFQANKAIKTMAGYDEWDARSNIVDMIANLFHLARLKNIDMEDAIRMAREHFEAETEQKVPQINT